MRAAEAAKSLPLDPAQQAAVWLRTLPLPGEAQGFFAPCGPAISAALRGAKCVLTADGGYVQPTQAVLCARPAVRELVGERLLRDLGLHYAHPALPETPLRAGLGVEEVGWAHLLALLRSTAERAAAEAATGGAAAGADAAGSREGLSWLVRVLSCMAECSSGAALPKEHVAALSGLRVLPLADGSVVAAADGPLYLPISAGAQPQQAQAAVGIPRGGKAAGPASKRGQVPHSAPQPDARNQAGSAAAAARAAGLDMAAVGVRLLHPGLADALAATADKGAGALRILRALGAAELSLSLLCERHALPVLLVPALKAAAAASSTASASAPALRAEQQQQPVPLLRAALLLLCANRGSLGASARAALARDAAVLTSAGPRRSADVRGTVLFTPAYGGPLVPSELPAADPWLWLDDGYAKQGSVPIADLRAFFSEIGVSSLGPCVPRSLSLTPSDKATSPWVSEDWSQLYRPEAPYLPVTVEDFAAPILEALLLDPETLARVSVSTLRAVARELNDTWGESWARFASATVLGASGGRRAGSDAPGGGGTVPSRQVHSSLVLAMRSAKWVPSKLNLHAKAAVPPPPDAGASSSRGGGSSAAAAAAADLVLSSPSEIFLRSREVAMAVGPAPVRFADLPFLISPSSGSGGGGGGWASPTAFAHSVGLRGTLDVAAALAALSAWSESGGPVPEPPDVAPLYKLLLSFTGAAASFAEGGGGAGRGRYAGHNSDWAPGGGADAANQAAASAAIQAERTLLAFPPRGASGADGTGASGEWVVSADVRMVDKTGIFEALPHGSAPHIRIWDHYEGLVPFSFFQFVLRRASAASACTAPALH